MLPPRRMQGVPLPPRTIEKFELTKTNTFQTRSSGVTVELPLFIPVYRPDYSFELFNDESYRYGLGAVMVNAFLLYREQGTATAFEHGYTLREHIGGFEGMLCTDSGAFQQLSGRKVNIDPLEIVRFQNAIKTDIAAPLDIITPPETGYDETNRRMIISHYRIREALESSGYADLAGIQQGGGFFSLRQKHIRQLADIGVKYYGIGSMVPFFNKNHDLSFTCGVISDARAVIGRGAPMHVYGAGDPLDVAFMFLAGANIFDSSSYAHYAQRGYYMTPYGAVNKRGSCEQLDFACACPVCTGHDISVIFDKVSGEHLRKQHNLFLILETIQTLREYSNNGQTETYVSAVYNKHTGNPDIFPGSMLARSWDGYLRGEKLDSYSADSGNAIKESLPVSVLIREAPGDDRNGPAPGLTAAEQTILEFLAAESAEVYKMDRYMILETLCDELRSPKNTSLRALINSVNSLKDMQRLSEYKVFRKNIRERLYQKLRRYKPSQRSINEILAEFIECGRNDIQPLTDKLLEHHVSTRERLPDKNGFIKHLGAGISQGSAVIDIGCGFAPLLLPASFYRNLSCYIAVDKDTEATETVRIFAEKYGLANLKAYTWDIGSGLPALNKLTGIDQYDVALMLKLIPVVSRADQAGKIESRSIPVLGGFPALKLLATVSCESMTKYENIEKRELLILKHFARDHDLVIDDEFSCGSETGYYLSKI